MDVIKKVLSWLPVSCRNAVLAVHAAPETWTEVRLRVQAPASVTDQNGTNHICTAGSMLTEEGMRSCLARICSGSVHAYDAAFQRGYLTPQDCPGVRVGLAGHAICAEERLQRLQMVTSLCIRLPHTVVLADTAAERLIRNGTGKTSYTEVPHYTKQAVRSTLFYAPPGGGKTTLLRHLIRCVSGTAAGQQPLRTAVIDAGEELYDASFSTCIADFFTGYPKETGITIATRAFSPQVIFCDELGSEADAAAILRAQTGGAALIATAHADTLSSLLRRPCFAALWEHGVFSQVIRLIREGDRFLFLDETEACG